MMVEVTSVALDRKIFQRVADTLGPSGSGMLNGAGTELLGEISKIATCPQSYAKYHPSFRRLVRRGVMKALELNQAPNDPNAIKGIKTIRSDVESMAATEEARWRIQRFAQYIASTPVEHFERR